MNARGSATGAAGLIPSLDGLRAIAVALVFAAHSGLEHRVPGGLGVTIFFVLSGYLITTLMRIEQQRHGRLAFGSFYLRRLLRLMPPLVIVLAGAAALSALSVIDGGFSVGGFFSALLYAANYHVIANNYQGLPAGIGVVWSLAVEEHFYIFYPPLAALLLRLRGATGAALLLLLCAAVLAWRLWLSLHGASADRITMASDTRVDAILVGCAMALWRNPWLDPVSPAHRVRDAGVVVACFGVLLASVLVRDELFRQTWRYTLQSLAVAGLLHGAVAHAAAAPWRWLQARPLVYLGTVSYTVYLSHHVILLALQRHLPDLGWLVLTLVGALLTLAVAEAMRRWVERPVAALSRRWNRRQFAQRGASAGEWIGSR